MMHLIRSRPWKRWADSWRSPPRPVQRRSSVRLQLEELETRLTPAGTDWSAMTVPFHYIEDDLPGTGSTPVKIEITERQPLGPHVRLLSGRLPAATPAFPAAAATE